MEDHVATGTVGSSVVEAADVIHAEIRNHEVSSRKPRGKVSFASPCMGDCCEVPDDASSRNACVNSVRGHSASSRSLPSSTSPTSPRRERHVQDDQATVDRGAPGLRRASRQDLDQSGDQGSTPGTPRPRCGALPARIELFDTRADDEGAAEGSQAEKCTGGLLHQRAADGADRERDETTAGDEGHEVDSPEGRRRPRPGTLWALDVTASYATSRSRRSARSTADG